MPPPPSTETIRPAHAAAMAGLAAAVIAMGILCAVLRPSPPPGKLESDYRININTADAAALQVLPGIGPALAERILTYRAETTFTSVEDLYRVPGIGSKTIQRIGAYVKFRH